MYLSMDKILNKFSDCNVFSLTGGVSRFNLNEQQKKELKNIFPVRLKKEYLKQYIEKFTITEEEFSKALEKIEDYIKEKIRKIYEDNKEKFANYPEFDKLYDEIKKECKNFDCEENRQFYINKHYGDDKIERYKKIGLSEAEINEMKNNFFQCSFITSNVGKSTKYGYEHRNFFWLFYHDVAMMIDRENDKKNYCIGSGKSPIEQIPDELKEHFLYYEISYYNSVTISGGLMINYYFKLNEETKKYLLKFKNIYELRGLDDLTLYKDNEIKFYSCTHEKFNSMCDDYRDMTNNEIIDFINNEYDGDNNDKIAIINKLINMEVGTNFSFKEIV